MIQRLHDYLHEIKIRRLGRLYKKAMRAHDGDLAVHYWLEHGRAINSRSWAQVRRMQRRARLAT